MKPYLNIKNPSVIYAFILSAVPFIVLILMIFKYAVNIPYQDQWGMLYLFDNYYSHSLSFSDFWQQHNEHRLVFPKLIFLILGILSGYNVQYEMFTSVFFALLICLLIICHINKNKSLLKIENNHRWLWIILSLMIFSLVQFENWLWGFQLQWFLNILAVTAGAFIVSNYTLDMFTFSLLTCCGIIATFSLSSGALYWIIILFFIIVENLKNKKRPSLSYIFIWALLFASIMTLYLCDYKKPGNHPGLFDFISMPFSFIAYILTYVGGPLSYRSIIFPKVLAGLFGVIIFVFYMSKDVIRKSPLTLKRQYFFLIIGLYSISTAVITAVGRVGLKGFEQAAASRYTSISILFWISLFVIIYVGRYHESIKEFEKRTFARAFKYIILSVIIITVAWSSYGSINMFKKIHIARRCGSHSVLHGEIKCLKSLYMNPDVLVGNKIPILKRLKLSVFYEHSHESGK